MRRTVDERLTKGRVRRGRLASDDSYGLTGCFGITCPETGRLLSIIASGWDIEEWKEASLDGKSWEHVSVSLPNRKLCPSWPEMDFVKGLFWEPGETVIQFHPAASEKINHHPGCLHLWKPPYDLPLPPGVTVGPPERGELNGNAG